MAGEELYDLMGSDYEAMVSWDKRLANELPFFSRLFEEGSVGRVADVACGAGRHAVAFASWGLEVVGADPSRELLALARAHAARSGADVVFVESDFANLARDLEGPFDAVVCIGNSLAHLPSAGEVLDALAQMNRLLRGGGTLVIQNRSAEYIWAKGSHLMPPTLTSAEGSDVIFLRMVEAHPPTITLNIIRLTGRAGTWSIDVKSTQLRPMGQPEMDELLAEAGFDAGRYYGDYQLGPFAGAKSEDLLVVAAKSGNGGAS